MPRPPGQQRKVLERTWIERGSYVRGALARRGERAGTPGPPPGRRIRPEETAPITLCYAHRQPSPGRGLNTHRDKARAGRRGDTCQGARGVRRQPSGRPSRQKRRLRRGVRDGRRVGSHRIRSVGAGSRV